MIVYRLLKNRYLDTPLSAEGARRGGGRWNPPGFSILYTSATPELALLEVLVHLNPLDELLAMSWVVLDVPEPGLVVDQASLENEWFEPQRYRSTQAVLTRWLENPDCVSVQVPSAIVPISANFLLHTGHPLFLSQVNVLDIEACRLDNRLKKA